MFLLRHPTLRLLFSAQALYWSCSIIGITLTSLAGLHLAPWKALATLPLALLVLGNLVAVIPLSAAMQRHGRRRALMLGAALGMAGGLLCALALRQSSFALLCLGAAGIGVYQASSGFYRHAALEAVEPQRRGRAAAWVVGGGVCAAVLAPPLAVWSRDALATPFAGAYLVIAGLAALGVATVSRLPGGAVAAPRPAPGTLRLLLARPALRAAVLMTAIGHGLMILVMNATPLAMDRCGFSTASAATVIQWHVIGMFLPAFFAGPMVDRFGARRVAAAGAAILAASACTALSGLEMAHFFASSLLLGLGWNLMVIAGTTLLAESHAPEERGAAQALMELCNGATAVVMSFGSGVLLAGIGWTAINLAALPLLALACAVLWIRTGLRPVA
ncbi:MFS transporter [Acidovorax sacchari]|uniref:MFS transporter n=1 Tax=Acidovorax sacchari TaxID=3230736 RepID=UPI0039E40A7E